MKYFHELGEGAKFRFLADHHAWIKTGPQAARPTFETIERYINPNTTVVLL